MLVSVILNYFFQYYSFTAFQMMRQSFDFTLRLSVHFMEV